MNKLYMEMMRTAENCGMKIIPDDFAQKLLAVVYCYGSESMVHDEKMSSDIEICRERFGIDGGKQFDKNAAKAISEFVKQIQNGTALWIEEVESKYGISLKEDMCEKNELRIYKSKLGQTNG